MRGQWGVSQEAEDSVDGLGTTQEMCVGNRGRKAPSLSRPGGKGFGQAMEL